MTDAEFNELVSAAVDGVLTDAQAAALNAELARSSARREDYLRQTWTSLLLETGFPSARLQPVRRPVSRKWIAAAACLLLFLGVAFAAMTAIRSVRNSEDGIGTPAVTAESRVSTSLPSATATTVRTADVGLSGAGLTTVYVATNGDDSAAGTVDAPFLTISNAVTQLGANGGTVIVKQGVYRIAKEILLTNDVSVLGATGNANDIVLTNSDHSVRRYFTLDSPRACVAGMTMVGGYVQQAGGATVKFVGQGGVVSNCVLRNGYAWNYYSAAAGADILTPSGLVTRCIITGCAINQDHENWDNAIAVRVRSGRLENSLICGNASAEVGPAVVTASSGGAVVNCTIVNNSGKTICGLRLLNGGVATNCVMVCNTNNTTGMNVPFLGMSNLCVNCATDDTTPLNDTCVIGTAATFFRDYAHGDFTPNESAEKGASLYDAGTDVGWTAANVDLAGKPRVVGKRIDIGCYESQKNSIGGFVIRIL